VEDASALWDDVPKRAEYFQDWLEDGHLDDLVVFWEMNFPNLCSPRAICTLARIKISVVEKALNSEHVFDGELSAVLEAFGDRKAKKFEKMMIWRLVCFIKDLSSVDGVKTDFPELFGRSHGPDINKEGGTTKFDAISFETVSYLEDLDSGNIYNTKHDHVGAWNEDCDEIIWISEVFKNEHENVRPKKSKAPKKQTKDENIVELSEQVRKLTGEKGLEMDGESFAESFSPPSLLDAEGRKAEVRNAQVILHALGVPKEVDSEEFKLAVLRCTADTGPWFVRKYHGGH